MSIPIIDPSALLDQSKHLRHILSKESENDLDPIDTHQQFIDKNASITDIVSNENQGGVSKRKSVTSDPMLSGVIGDSNESNVNLVLNKSSLSSVFSEIDALTNTMSVPVVHSNTSSDEASQSIKSTFVNNDEKVVLRKEEEQDKLALAARLKAKLEEKTYSIPSFSNLLMDPYDPSTDPYSTGTNEVNASSSINTIMNPVPTLEPIKVWSLELGDTSPINERSTPSTPDKMPVRKASKKSKKNSIAIVTDDGMDDSSTVVSGSTTANMSSNSSSNSIANAAELTPTRKGSSKRGDKDRGSTYGDTTSGGGGGGGTKKASTGPKVKNIKDLKIKVRPTEPLRSGHLYKLDVNNLHIDGTEHDVNELEEEEEEAWITQYVTMDITAGMLEYFTEING